MSRRGYEFSNETKELARKKARYCCERCGKEGRTEVHHRIPIYIAKQYPELSQAMISSLANAEILCSDCHDIADKEIHNWGQYALALFGAVQTSF